MDKHSLLTLATISLVADRIGPINTDAIFLTITGLSTLLIWMFAYDFSTLVGYSIVLGLFCGSYFALGKLPWAHVY